MFNTIIRIGLEAFIDLIFSSIFNLKTITFKNSTDIYSDVVSIIWLTLMVILFWFVIAVPFITKPGYDEEKLKKSKFRVLLKDFKANSVNAWLLNWYCFKRFNLWLLENVMFLFRRVLIVFITLFIGNNGTLQVLIVLSWTLIIMTLKILIKPFKNITK